MAIINKLFIFAAVFALVFNFGCATIEKSRVSAAPETGVANAELRNTLWKLVELDSKPIPLASSVRNQIRITLAKEDSRASGFSGCNRFTGSFEQIGDELRFSQLISTRMACLSPEMEVEGQILKMLNSTTHYRIESEYLLLFDGDKLIARFESLYLR